MNLMTTTMISSKAILGATELQPIPPLLGHGVESVEGSTEGMEDREYGDTIDFGLPDLISDVPMDC